MRKATRAARALVTNILVHAFDDNFSVNYLIPQDKRRKQRIKRMMEYSFDQCLRAGAVYLNETETACALVLFPEQKKHDLQGLWLDAKLIAQCIGIGNMRKAMKREILIKQQYPDGPAYYLWFLGVHPDCQKQGLGSALLQELQQDAVQQNRRILLETSVARNVSWYEQSGFEVYRQLDFGNPLYLLQFTGSQSARQDRQSHK